MKDTLAREPYAKKIAEEISDHYDTQKEAFTKGEVKERENMVFAISAKWGEGKTELLNFLEKPLQKKGFRIIRFNPWKYSQADIALKRAFLCTLKEELKSDVNLDDLYFDTTKSVVDINLSSFIKLLTATSFLYFIFLPQILGFSFVDWLTITTIPIFAVKEIPLVGTLLTLIIIPIFLNYVHVNRRASSVTTAEEFENKFKSLLQFEKKIVFYIDDLDRCNSGTVKMILDSLRTFFQHPECSYIITADHTVIEKYAGEELGFSDKEQNKKLTEGRRFLKKLFDVYWRLPLPTPYQFEKYVDDKIKLSKINLLNETQISNLRSPLVDVSLFERNPRHIKRFLTSLRFALESVRLQKEATASDDPQASSSKKTLQDILDNPDLLSKVLLIQEHFYKLYEELILHPEALVEHEKYLRGGGEPQQLRIGLKDIKALLDNDVENLEQYVALVKSSPQFTDENNTTLHEVSSYFFFSGSTGLPVSIGPDESNFEQYLRSGSLYEKLGENLKNSTEEKKERFVQKHLEILTAATTDNEKATSLKEALKLSEDIDAWSDKINEWKNALVTLPPEQRAPLVDDFWKIVLEKKPVLIDTLKSENPELLESLWVHIQNTDTPSISKEAIDKIETHAIQGFKPESFGLNIVEASLKLGKFPKLKAVIDNDTKNLDACRTYCNEIERIGIQDKVLSGLVKDKMVSLMKLSENFPWLIANHQYLKDKNLFDGIKKTYYKIWLDDKKTLVEIANNKDVFALNDVDLDDLIKSIMEFIQKSSDLSFLSIDSIKNLLNKEKRILIFTNLSEIVADSLVSVNKRTEAVQLLLKDNNFWDNFSLDDVHESLQKLNGAKLKKLPKIQEKVLEILDSWGYNREK